MKQAMIFAAGLGTRLRPLTDTMPKALVEVGGKPLLWHVIHRLGDAGFGRIVINVHHFADQIAGYLRQNDNFGMDISLSDETEQLLETGGGIRHALPLFDTGSPILIHNVDIMSNTDLTALYDFALQSQADSVLLVSRRQTRRYLIFDEEYILDGWINLATGEVKSPYDSLLKLKETALPQQAADAIGQMGLRLLAFSGIHVVSPRIFPLLEAMPERFGIMDFYLKYCHQCAFLGHVQDDLRLVDVGKVDTLNSLNRHPLFNQQQP